ncbi:MAG: histidine kinase [Hydrocarboniphaga sp.]|uniref:sensor histidine kinase n=1 Tax=Hydrocarboniphaga sp. TaxID=2033016 RepID=UPI0026152AF8|nr:HAMP domain-containing sensor histidine kinase [Hydrocarboniphaga sp.]MDB5971693.1 histidine kinase [Hydrocarboniphaga sp.]
MSRLYLRLLLWFCVANVATMVVSVFVTERIARYSYGDDPDWAEIAEQANSAYIEHGQPGLINWIESQRRRGIEARLYENEQSLGGPALPMPRPPPELLFSDSPERRPPPGERVAGHIMFGRDGVPRRLITVAQVVVGRDGVTRQLVAMRRPRPPFPRMEQVLATQIGVSTLVIGIVGWWIARTIARPVAAVRAAARRFASGDLAARVPPRFTRSSDEVGDLARDFDRMAGRIETLVTSERGVLQDVSHELRSPLARLHLLLDLARRTPTEEAAAHFDRAEHEISRLDLLIGQALALSRLETDLPGSDRQPFDLSELLRSRIKDWQLEAGTRGIGLELVELPAISIAGSQELIGRAIDNLLANAIKFSDDGGRVQIGLSRRDGGAEIRVRDRGPGVPAEDLPRLFRPFFRGTNAARAEGHGLGLAIIQRVVIAHRGSVTAANAEGGGLEVVLRLPA